MIGRGALLCDVIVWCKIIEMSEKLKVWNVEIAKSVCIKTNFIKFASDKGGASRHNCQAELTFCAAYMHHRCV